MFAEIEQSAIQNDWVLIAAIQTHPGGDGFVPHGIALAQRRVVPFPGREFSTHSWSLRPEGAFFGGGNYDLTLEDALADFIERAGSLPAMRRAA